MSKHRSYKGIKHNNIYSNDKVISGMIISNFILIVIFISTFFQGLLFEEQYFKAILIIGGASALWLLIMIIKRDNIEWNNPITLLSIGFVISYGLSIINAAYTRSAVISFSKHFIILMLVLTFLNLKTKSQLKRNLLHFYFFTGVAIAVLGLDALFGENIIGILNHIVARDGVSEGKAFLSEMLVGTRLASVFQYPNTTASFLLTSWLIGIGLVVKTNNIIKNIMFGIGTTLCASGFILTLSRGAYLLAFLLIICFILLIEESRLLCAASLIISGSFSLILVSYTTHREIKSLGIKGWLVCLLLSIIASIMIYLTKTITTKLKLKIDSISNEKKIKLKYRRLYALTAAIIIACSAVIWFWTEPITLDAEKHINIVRNVKLGETNKYQLELILSDEINEGMSEIKIYINSRSIKEIITKKNANLLSINMVDLEYVKKDEKGYYYRAEFVLEDNDAIEQTLTIQGKMGNANNKVCGIRIIDESTGNIVKLRLKQKLINETLSQRIESIFTLSSSFSRLAFYYDGINIFKDNYLLGTGGGGWEYLYNSYQGYDYTSKDIHSFALQLLIEVGILGIVLIILMLFLIIWKFFDLRKKPNIDEVLIWIGTTGILLHSMIDFDFAFYSMYLIFWSFISLLDFPEIRLKRNIIVPRYINYSATVILLFLSLIWPFRFNQAITYAIKYSYAYLGSNVTLAEKYLRKAIAYDPLNADYKVSLANLIISKGKITQDAFDDSKEIVAKARKQSSNNYKVLIKISSYYQNIAEWDAAYEVENRITTICPLTIYAWQSKAYMIQNAIDWYKENGDEEGIKKWLQRGVEIEGEMSKASYGKLIEIRPNKELKETIAVWKSQMNDL